MPTARPYQAKTWTPGDVITSASMNHIEETLASLDAEVLSARTENNSAANTIGARLDDLIQISPTEPGGQNEIWVQEDSVKLQIPSYDEFFNLSNVTVRYDGTQVLTDAQKELARNNITAAAQSDISNLYDNIAEEYEAKIYQKGDYVLHNNHLYRAKQDINPSDSVWTSAHWEEVQITDELSAGAENVVMVSASQPQEEANRLWILETPTDETTVPTIEEFNALASDVADLQTLISTDSNHVLKVGTTTNTQVILLGNRRINFNSDGSVTWEPVT